MKKVTVSAPGKLMLFGEHAVVYGRPCIVTAVGQRMQATVALIEKPVFQLNAPDVQITNYQKPITNLGQGEIPKGAKFVEAAIKNFTSHKRPGLTRLKGIKVTTKSEFNSQFGFGGSSASTVCVVKALSELTGAKLNNKTIFKLAYKTVLDIQGVASGFDVAAGIYGGTLYFLTGGQAIEPINVSDIPLVVGYSGIKADTVEIVNQVKEKAAKKPKLVENIYDNIADLVAKAKVSLQNRDWEELGVWMNHNQEHLASLGVSSDELDNMIDAARSSGAYGAKLSGAGVGDCMIALAPGKSRRAVEQAINQAGGQSINIEANVEGVRIER